MAEIVNPRLMGKISSSKYGKSIKEFLKEAIREEFEHADQSSWRYGEFYEKKVEEFASAKSEKEEAD